MENFFPSRYNGRAALKYRCQDIAKNFIKRCKRPLTRVKRYDELMVRFRVARNLYSNDFFPIPLPIR